LVDNVGRQLLALKQRAPLGAASGSQTSDDLLTPGNPRKKAEITGRLGIAEFGKTM
jgi:hypothetical protein